MRAASRRRPSTGAPAAGRPRGGGSLTIAARLGAPTGTGTPPESPGADTIDLALNWTTNGFQAPLFYAAERGRYQDVT